MGFLTFSMRVTAGVVRTSDLTLVMFLSVESNSFVTPYRVRNIW